jgi:hypothetical protein
VDAKITVPTTARVTLDRGLFEVPPGVRVMEDAPDDAGMTRVMGFGDLEESEQLLAGFDPEALIRNTRAEEMLSGLDAAGAALGMRTVRLGRRAGQRGVVGAAVGPGARFVYALVLVALNLGVMGLAASWQHPGVLLVTAMFALASSILLWVFWRSWLDGLPYAYRLLTSLGEDAENLLHWRLFRRGRVRSLYR